MSFIVLASNDYGRVAAFGTVAGRPFKSERSAQKAADANLAESPALRYLVLDIEPNPIAG